MSLNLNRFQIEYEAEENLEFSFFGLENACRLEPCENGGTCVFAPGLEPPYGKRLALGTSWILPGLPLNCSSPFKLRKMIKKYVAPPTFKG